jgi:hypothetical protein
MPEYIRSPESSNLDSGPYLARIVSHIDAKYMGSLTVELLRDIGNVPRFSGQIYTVKYLSPFYGVTSLGFNTRNQEYNATQKSYGMWMVPPDVGTIVMVIFAEGDSKQGFWIGCVQDEYMNFMVPGLAATTYNPDRERKPVAEYNKRLSTDTNIPGDTTKIEKPVHPFYEALKTQGLEKDEIRGYTTSSARREVPSSVFGISTPGPLDKSGPIGDIGVEQSRAKTFVSRLGGSSFVMDDGDDKFVRKTTPAEGPPEYASIENGESGNNKIPHNELIRLRTRTGHQIVLHNSEDLIYIGNSKGTAWIELTGDGKIDIYAEDSVSLHTKQDLNFFADRDINLEAGRNFNIKVKEEMHTNVLKDQILIVDGMQKIHVKKDVFVTYDEKYNHLVKQDVDIQYEAALKHKIQGEVNVTNESGVKFSVANDFDLNVSGSNKLSAGANTEIKSGGKHVEEAPAIQMNGGAAAEAAKAEKSSETPEIPKILKTHSLPDKDGKEMVKSIMRRVPSHEPWPLHENLDPKKFKPEKTDRDVDGRVEGESSSMNETPEKWTKELTLDTFKKIGK